MCERDVAATAWGRAPARPPGPRWAGAALLVLLAAVLMGAPCRPGSLKTILVDAPVDGLLVDDPSATVVGAARVGTNIDLATVEVRIDGVDLIAALGLTPPFSDAAGMVLVGPTPVQVSGFSLTLTNPRHVDVTLAGLPLGSHLFEVSGTKTDTTVVITAAAGFDVLDPFVLAADHVPAGGAGPLSAGTEGTVFSSSVGQPFAAPPIGLSGGGSLRSGFVEVSEAFVAASAP